MTEAVELKLSLLPDSPGCYIMKHAGEVIYVGKAVNLKNRVRQYFHERKDHTPKVRAMAEKVDDFDIILVGSELEAFALECNLIKLYKPHYNILLKDDKHYPYLKIDTNRPYPKIELVRSVKKDGAKYFGPYRGTTVVREVLDVVRMVFPVRPCLYNLNPEKKMRPCVHHQIGLCPAPCAGLISVEDYSKHIDRVIEFLNGRYQPIIDELTARMNEAAKSLNYERAALCRDRLRAVEAVMEKQQAISVSMEDRDVIAADVFGSDAFAELLMIRSGRLIGSEYFVFDGEFDADRGEIITQFILQYYNKGNTPPHEILVNTMPEEAETLSQLLSETAGRKVSIIRPQRGEKTRLIGMAARNLADIAKKHFSQAEHDRARTIGAMEELALELGLDKPPRRIEGYDISNTQGAQSVASMVVMIDGACANREYRRFRIKTVTGANDFASMREVITRRLAHAQKEIAERTEAGLPLIGGKFSDLPDLILIDGGRGQLNFAMEAMADSPYNIPMFGLAERIEEIVLPYENETLLLDRHSNALHAIVRLRDEAHRFAITYHRALRGKHTVSSKLDEIPGIGEKRRRALLKRFSSMEKLKQASVDELSAVDGMNRPAAENLYGALHAGGNAQNADGE